MQAKRHIPLAIACSVMVLAFCANGAAQDKPTAGKPAAATPQPSSTSPAPSTPTPSNPATPIAKAPPAKGSATVEFRDGLLHIVATDADLNSVLQQVSRVTGMRLQGGTHGDRLYGDYGPAFAADVLDHMLVGLPYNFIMTQAPRTTAPQQLVISSRHSSAATGTNGASNGNPTVPPPSVEPQPYQPEPEEPAEPAEAAQNEDGNFSPSNPPPDLQPDNANGQPAAKTPEQFLEELRKLQQQSGSPQ